MPVELAGQLAEIAGSANVLTDADLVAGYTVDWTGRWRGPAALVVRPASTAEVAAVVAACRAAGVAVIPQGGNTGLVGGGVPGPAVGGPSRVPWPVILSLIRMTELDAIDEMAGQVTASAGVTLARLQEWAAASGLSFAVDLAARDSATVGGMVATNAGGIKVLRYGGMRQQVVGVEAVLADGRVISRLDGLVKDNTGYCLSDLLVGSEGTLGVVTRARLRLVPLLGERVTALLGLADTGAALQVLAGLRRSAAGLEAAEIFYQQGLDLVRAHAGLPPPLPRPFGAYLLVECAGEADPTDSLAAALASLAGFMPTDDATAVATDTGGRAALWAYRERHTEAVNGLGVPHKLDVTLPLGRLAEFEASVRTVVASVAPGAVAVLWGHVGDGNLHVNVVGPAPDDERVDDAVLQLVARLGGSISAEHGIGRAKVRWLSLTRSAAEIDAMTAIKRALDPAGTLNPGVLLPMSSSHAGNRIRP